MFLTWRRKSEGCAVAMGGVVNAIQVFSRIAVEVGSAMEKASKFENPVQFRNVFPVFNVYWIRS